MKQSPDVHIHSLRGKKRRKAEHLNKGVIHGDVREIIRKAQEELKAVPTSFNAHDQTPLNDLPALQRKEIIG